MATTIRLAKNGAASDVISAIPNARWPLLTSFIVSLPPSYTSVQSRSGLSADPYRASSLRLRLINAAVSAPSPSSRDASATAALAWAGL